MVNALQKLLKIIQALVKLLPTIIDVLQDLNNDESADNSSRTRGEAVQQEAG